jgi:uncharacterized metal-binding protein
MKYAKFSIRDEQAEFIDNCQTYGFKDKSSLIRTAIDYFKKNLEADELKKSAEIYSEIYSKDDDLKELTKTAINGWPE